jgi:hypothetical protein
MRLARQCPRLRLRIEFVPAGYSFVPKIPDWGGGQSQGIGKVS